MGLGRVFAIIKSSSSSKIVYSIRRPIVWRFKLGNLSVNFPIEVYSSLVRRMTGSSLINFSAQPLIGVASGHCDH